MLDPSQKRNEVQTPGLPVKLPATLGFLKYQQGSTFISNLILAHRPEHLAPLPHPDSDASLGCTVQYLPPSPLAWAAPLPAEAGVHRPERLESRKEIRGSKSLWRPHCLISQTPSVQPHWAGWLRIWNSLH